MQIISLMLSGGLGHTVLQQIFKTDHQISSVFTDRKSTAIRSFCETHAIPLFVGNPRKGKATDFIKQHSCEILLSVNYLFLIEKDVIDWPSKYAINLHGSLLPKYRGRTPHVWAIINGEKETGVTAHIIDEKVDNGQIVDQIKIPISKEDTGADILTKYNEEYPKLITNLLNSIEADTLELRVQDNSKAIYFGKRTPDDGKIDWNWSRIRIYNWIRAQAKPYPGAFTFLNNQKIIIHKSTFSDTGFRQETINGSILDFDDQSITVKTPTGALRLEHLELPQQIIIKKGLILTFSNKEFVRELSF